MKKFIIFILSIGNAAFTLTALYMAYNFYYSGDTEQALVTLFFSVISFILFIQLSKK